MLASAAAPQMGALYMIKSLADTWEKVLSRLSSAKQGKKMSPSVNFHRNKGTGTGLHSLPLFDFEPLRTLNQDLCFFFPFPVPRGGIDLPKSFSMEQVNVT